MNAWHMLLAGDKTIVKEKELNSQGAVQGGGGGGRWSGEKVSIESNNKGGKWVSGNWLSIPENVEL